MELPHIGQNCVVCNRNDYLPFKCTYCDKMVCIDHKSNHGTNCPLNNTSFTTETPANFESLKQKCDFCKKITLKLELTECQYCKFMHCLYHRHQVQHTCPKLAEDKKAHLIETEERQERQKKALDNLKAISGPSPKPIPIQVVTDPKKKALAKRVRIMQLKQSARGPPNILSDDKIYFEVKLAQHREEDGIGKETKMIKMYATAKHTVGRMIDWVAAEFDLTNNNNIAGARQLVFQKELDSGELLTIDNQRCFGDLLDKELEDGDNLLLTYKD